MSQIANDFVFQPVPDPEGNGFFRYYLIAKSTILKNTSYKVEIDFDVCAPFEHWELTHYYKGVQNSVEYDARHTTTVYRGKELTPEQRDMMVRLVTEYDYLTFLTDAQYQESERKTYA